MTDTDGPTLSRRRFLAACGACGTVGMSALASTPAAADGRQQLPSGDAGSISPEGQAAIAEVDDQLAQQGGDFGRTVNAVSDLGLDPSGNTPISQPLEAAMNSLSNVRIVFPSDGIFQVKGRIVLNPAGPVELVGNGATLKLAPGTKVNALNCPNLPGGTRISGFVIDQTASDSVSGIRIGSNGTVEVRDMTVKGYAPSTPNGEVAAVLTPIARTPSATVRITNFSSIGGTAAGMHSDPNKPESAPENRLSVPIGMWVGQSSTGTIQLVNPRMRGWANGTYSSRTKGTVQILGGLLWNNNNTQERIGGGAIIDGTTMVLDDRKWSKNQNPGPYTLGGNQGVHAVRVETGGTKGNQSDPVRIRNLDVRALSMVTSSSLINFEGSAPAGTITNSRLENHIGVPSILAASPGSQGGYSGAAQTNVLVDQSLFTGSSSGSVIEVNDRPASRIQRTCIQISGAGPESISGMQIGPGMGFGRTCSAGGLRDPSAVGSGANVSNLNLSAVNGSVALPAQGASQGGIIKAMVTAVFMIIGGIAALIGGLLALALLAGGIGTVVAYLLADQK